MYIKEEARNTPVVAQPDVLIVGAGPAGVVAALAAARNGTKVLLVEHYGFLGGNLTAAMINPMFTFHDIHGRQVILGIAEEIVNELVKIGGSLGHVTDLTLDNASMTPFDPEAMKYVLFKLVEEAGVELLLHTTAVGVLAVDGTIDAVLVENKSGRQAIRANVVIDCTADADLVAFASAPYMKGRQEDGAMQPVSLFFRIAGVDMSNLRCWMKENRHLLKGAPTDVEIDSQKALAFLGMSTQVTQAALEGNYPAEAAPRILFYQLPIEGQIAVNVSRLQNIDGTNASELTKAEVVTHKQAWEIQRYLKQSVGGFANSYLLDTGVQVGVRETRHIVGDYILTEQDVLEGKAFPDGVACGTFAIDIHPPEGKQQIFTGSGRSVYEIPYRCLLPQGYDNILVAGRSISATHAAFGSVRVMATCMAMGQGAGTAAAMAVLQRSTTRQVDVVELRCRLVQQGQYLLAESLPVVVEPGLELKRSNDSGAQASHHNPYAK